MIRVLFSFAMLMILSLVSCNKNNGLMPGDLQPSDQDEQLISLIVMSPSVEAIEVSQLLPNIRAYVNEHHAPMSIAWAFTAGQHGHEIFLESGLCLYFDQHGNHLDHDGLHGDHGNHHGGGDPGINFCMMGDTLDNDQLPMPAIQFITDHYPSADISFVVIKPSGNFGVEFSTGDVLMFGPNGEYIKDCEHHGVGGHGHMHGMGDFMGWHCETGGMMGGHGGPHGHMGNLPGIGGNCWGGTGNSIEDLPVTIMDYVAESYPDSTILHVTQTFNGNYFLRLSGCIRVVFDSDGNVLFDSGL